MTANPKRSKTKTATRRRKTAAVKKKTTTARKTTTAAKTIAAPKLSLESHPCRLVSVFGPFGSKALVEMPMTWVENIFKKIGMPPGPARAIIAVEQDIEELRARAPELAESGLAATALALAYELDHPGNSATSKSMCARALNETMEKLRALAPPAEEPDAVDELTRRREERRQQAADSRRPRSDRGDGGT